MKKILAALLAGLILLAAAGCGDKKEEQSAAEEPQESQAQQDEASQEAPSEPEEQPDIPPDPDTPSVDSPAGQPQQGGQSGGDASSAPALDAPVGLEGVDEAVIDRAMPQPDQGSNVQPSLPARQTLTTDKSSYPVGTEKITVSISNVGESEGGYGLMYRIEHNAGSGWIALPLEIEVIEIAAILSPGQTNTETINLYPGQYDYQPGVYRVVMTDAPEDMIAQFTLE